LAAGKLLAHVILLGCRHIRRIRVIRAVGKRSHTPRRTHYRVGADEIHTCPWSHVGDDIPFVGTLINSCPADEYPCRASGAKDEGIVAVAAPRSGLVHILLVCGIEATPLD